MTPERPAACEGLLALKRLRGDVVHAEDVLTLGCGHERYWPRLVALRGSVYCPGCGHMENIVSVRIQRNGPAFIGGTAV